MCILIFGSGSFLGKAFFEYTTEKNIQVYGTSEYIKNNEKIFITDYTTMSLLDILNKTKPLKIYDFKTNLVSSNAEDFKEKNNEVKFTNNIVSAISEHSKNITLNKINLISTNYLDDNTNFKNLDHPYLKAKKIQETTYQSLNKHSIHVNIFRPPSVVGVGDLNFSRLIPYFVTTQLLKKQTILNSFPENVKEFITIDTFNKNLIEEKLDFPSITYSNEELTNLLLKLLDKHGIKTGHVSWKSNKEKLKKIKPKKNTNENRLAFENQLDKTVEWYINNLDLVKNQFKKITKF